MSLLMDILKRIKQRREHLCIHPFFLKKTQQRKVSKPFVIAVSSAVLVFASTATFLITQKFFWTERNMYSGAVINKQENLEVAQGNLRISRKPEEAETVKENAILQDTKKIYEELEENKIVEDIKKDKKEEVIERKEILQAKASNLKEELVEEKLLITGNLEEDRKEKKETEKEATEKKEEKPKKDIVGLLLKANQYFKQGDYFRSLKLYEEVFKVKKDVKIANNLIVLYVRTGLYEKAEEVLKEINDERLIYTLILELAKAGKTEKALRLAEKYEKKDENGLILFVTGYLHEKLKNYKKAFEYYRRAFEKNPSNPYIAFNYARMLELKGNIATAGNIYRVLALQSSDENIRKLAEQKVKYYKSIGILK